MANRHDPAVADEFELHVAPLFIPAHQRESQAIGGKGFEALAIRNNGSAKYRLPAIFYTQPDQARTCHVFDQREIENRQVTSVVHMAIEVEIVRQHPQVEFDGVADLYCRLNQRPYQGQDEAQVQVHLLML